MWLGIVSLFPELVAQAADSGVVGRAVRNGIVDLRLFNPRSYTTDKHQSVDDSPYGGGPGMLMMVEPLLQAVEAARECAPVAPRVIYLTPQGAPVDQQRVSELSREQSLVLVAGRYEGVDQRFVELAVDEELSIGDYVLSGGELPALVLMDAMVRLLPGVLGNAASAEEESHLDGLLDYPQYTRPENVRGLPVPELLLSGDHRAVARWRRQQALLHTWRKRPDMLAERPLDDRDRLLLNVVLTEVMKQELGGAFAAVEETEGAKKQDH